MCGQGQGLRDDAHLAVNAKTPMAVDKTLHPPTPSPASCSPEPRCFWLPLLLLLTEGSVHPLLCPLPVYRSQNHAVPTYRCGSCCHYCCFPLPPLRKANTHEVTVTPTVGASGLGLIFGKDKEGTGWVVEGFQPMPDGERNPAKVSNR